MIGSKVWNQSGVDSIQKKVAENQQGEKMPYELTVRLKTVQYGQAWTSSRTG